MENWRRRRCRVEKNRRGWGRSALSPDFDALSGLLSRRGFSAKTQSLVSAHPDERYVLVYGDIDRFKVYNDRFGTAAGDQLLAAVGAVIRKALPEHAVAARLRADHFVSCLPRSAFDPDRILALFDDWFTSYRQDFTFFVRLGIFAIDDPELDVSLMCDRALLALRSAKSSADSSKYAFYDKTLRDSVIKEQELAGEMATALDQGQFPLFFQPQYSYATKRMIGAEVLARWDHPVKGLLGPLEFIPVFERTGLIYDFDHYIWEQSCQCLRAWIDRYGLERTPRLSVNLSRIDIYQEDLCEQLCGLIAKYAIPKGMLHIEITEGAYTEAPVQLVGIVAKLQEAGFQIEMDDFGSGFSSLNTLKDVPIDVLKLDMGFLDARESTRGGLILASVVRMARWLDLPTIAEGVETPEQAAYLASIGCTYMQGYLFSRPIALEAFEELFLGGLSEEICRPLSEGPGEGSTDLWSADTQFAHTFSDYVNGQRQRHETDMQRYAAVLCTVYEEIFEFDRVHDTFRMLYSSTLPSGGATISLVDALARLMPYIPLEADRVHLKKMLEESSQSDGREPLSFTYRLKVDDDTTWRQSTILRVSDTSMLCCNKDVTELVEAEERSRHESAWQSERYRRLIETTRKISFDYDSELDTVLFYLDRAGKGTEEEVIPHYLETMSAVRSGIVHADSIETVRGMFERARAGENEMSVEYQADYYGRGYAWYRADMFVAHDDAGAWHLVGLIENIDDERALRFRAEYDAATGLNNHAATQDLIVAALADAEVRGHSVCVVMDIDDFKQVNDTCGHIQGDMLLHEVGGILRACFRKSDILGRVGGDEFVLLLKNIDVQTAVHKLEQVRLQVSAVRENGMGQPLSVSVGVYETQPDDRTYRDVFIKADEALYRAKRSGKDRICLHAFSG
ncbi:MAG: EAL domain-containing protein [Gordonibacter sp.]|uniref:bifunctional diguanylate cyclase/phosphodiesterase n=1 Tax=Gordonibacter sp. TaxID=1968902 RepID=UPI002FCA7C05